MRSPLPHLLALVLGVAAAVAIGCGSSNEGTIPKTDVNAISSSLDDVRARIDDGRCGGVQGAVDAVRADIAGLRGTVPSKLVNSLDKGARKLRGAAQRDCTAVAEQQLLQDGQQTDTTTTETGPTGPTGKTPPGKTQTGKTDTTQTDTTDTGTGTGTTPPTDTSQTDPGTTPPPPSDTTGTGGATAPGTTTDGGTP